MAVGWAASAAALSSARTGRLDDVEALARRATAADHPGLLRFTSGFGRITALLMAGRLTEARTLAQRYTDFAELQQPGRAIGETLVGYVAIAQGDFDDAVTLLGRAADPLARTGYSWGPLSLMLLAQALGQQGEQLHAAKAFSRAESLHGLKSSLFAPELALAKAWSKAAHGDTTGAIEAARDAVQTAERGGQSAVALRALQDAARLGDMRAVQRAGRLAGEVNCVLGRLTLAHARALADRRRRGAGRCRCRSGRPGTAPRGRGCDGARRSAASCSGKPAAWSRHAVIWWMRHQLIAGVREIWIAGPVVDRGDAQGGEPRRRSSRISPAPARRRVDEVPRPPVDRPGSAPAAESVCSIRTSRPSRTSWTWCSAASGDRSGANRKFTVTERGVGYDIAGNAAVDAYRQRPSR